MRKALWVVGGLVVVVVVLVLAIPYFLNADRYRPEVEARLKIALGREVRLGHLSASLTTGGVQASDITIADDPNFSKTPFIQAKSLDVGVQVWPLIKDRQVLITSLSLNNPEVTLLQSADGKWNFSSLGSGSKSSSGTSSSSDLSVDKVAIVDGKVTVGSHTGKTQSYTGVNLKAEHISLKGTTPSPFKLTADAPNGGSLSIDGTVGPFNFADMAQTPLQASLSLKNFDLAATGFISPDAGLSGTIDYDGKLDFNGKTAHSEGVLKSKKLRLAKNGTPASQLVTVNYASDYDIVKQSGVLTKGDLQTGKSNAHLSGSFDLHAAAAVVHLKALANGMSIQDINGLLPALGITLPPGASLQGGTVDANLNIDGPADKMVTAGTLAVKNTKLANFSLGSSLSAVAALAGIKKGPDTIIQLLSSNLRNGPDGTHVDNLNLVVQDLGSVTGSGSVSPQDALNFRMVANLNGTTQSVLGGLSQLAGLKSAPNRLPFSIQGTTSKPVFVPDVGGLVQSGLQSGFGRVAPQQGKQPSQNPIGDIIGLFGKKK